MDSDSESPTCVVSWPSAPLTYSLVTKALQVLDTPLTLASSVPPVLGNSYLVQWSSYDQIDHNLTHSYRQNVLSSSYIFRKALIRKHFLARCIRSYVTKHATSSLIWATPRTFEFELSFSDELDELWADDLWELGEELTNAPSWWILKPSVRSDTNVRSI
jgi:tubulin--tyrosine ligase